MTDLRAMYVTALQNAHALEMQALQIMERQVERLEHYPEMSDALRKHIAETHGQRDRLEEMLRSQDASPSTLKEGVLGFMGNMAALAHTPATDEVLKNAFANRAFENYEAAAYDSLIVFAESAGDTRAVPGLTQSLREEQAMAARVAELVRPTTARFLQLSAEGRKADR